MAQTCTPSRSAGGGYRTTHIAGGFVKLTTHQLVLAYWLYRAGHITRRQLRVFFAAAEMLERRRHTDPKHGPEQPRYRVEELAKLVGGRGSAPALNELRADARKLGRVGLVHLSAHSIRLAVSADEIQIDDISGFWAMFQEIPNRRRSVPIPRRTLRALAAGFDRAVTAVMIALLIRGLFWHREEGDYRRDHRTKLSWISQTFQVSRRAVTDARAKLVELGWLEPVDCKQWELNRWGVRDRIQPDWKPADAEATQIPDTADGGGGEGDVDSASPRDAIPANSARPSKNSSASLTRTNPKTRKLGGPDPTGLCTSKSLKGSRKTKRGGGPNIRDIQSEHLVKTQDLLELHRQAVEVGLTASSEAGRLDFLALAERARTRGQRPGALLAWLLREKRFEFITQADEDAAAERLREWHNGPCERSETVCDEGRPRKRAWVLSQDERVVQVCLTAGRQHGRDPFHLARDIKGWSRERWEQTFERFEENRMAQWR